MRSVRSIEKRLAAVTRMWLNQSNTLAVWSWCGRRETSHNRVFLSRRNFRRATLFHRNDFKSQWASNECMNERESEINQYDDQSHRRRPVSRHHSRNETLAAFVVLFRSQSNMVSSKYKHATTSAMSWCVITVQRNCMVLATVHRIAWWSRRDPSTE